MAASFLLTVFTDDAAPLPAAPVCRGIGNVLVVKDSAGQKLAYVYFEDEPGRRSAENLMSHDEGGALALNIAKLREWLART